MQFSRVPPNQLKLKGGIAMFPEKSMPLLEEIFRTLTSKLDGLNKDAVRDRKLDFNVVSEDELHQKLQSEKKAYGKRRLLLTQVGYLRINIFHEYYERIQKAQETGQISKALELMNDYIETVALPFLQPRLHQSLLEHLKRVFSSDRNPDAAKLLQDWNVHFKDWVSTDGDTKSEDSGRLKDYAEMKTEFITLYTLSFSFDNFPPVATELWH